jgi:hypothetical protein
MSKANYMIIEDEDDCLCIQDIGPWNIYMTVTNAAEEVVKELADQLGDRRLEYIDTDGQRDELLHEDGEFVGFKPIKKGK